MNFLDWLPGAPDFKEKLKRASSGNPAERLAVYRELAGANLDFVQTQQLGARLSELSKDEAASARLHSVKLAVLASSTFDYLVPMIRVAGLRHGLWIDVYLAPYNQVRQEALQPSPAFRDFRPDVVLFAMDTQAEGPDFSAMASGQAPKNYFEEKTSEWMSLWQAVKKTTEATVVQQSLVVPPIALFGNAELTVPETPASLLGDLNRWLSERARAKDILLFDVESLAARVGKGNWLSPSLWFHAKQPVSPVYGPLYADCLARLLGANVGRSRKVLVVDLDNTLWGGVIGDDGLEGIDVGQGTGPGEAYVAFQRYLKDLKARGVLLGVCSKNEEKNAVLPFDRHPGMILKRDDFSVFNANWKDKATNLEAIAKTLNVGLDSLVFFDDNPAERALIRQLLPAVAVPEVSGDAADFSDCLSRSGLFESFSFTNEDRGRAGAYQANVGRENLQSSSKDIGDYLKNLKMEMTVSPFDDVGADRIAQLINKSNQFNLTTRRYSLEQVRKFQKEKGVLTMQVHLTDRFGDNGMIGVVIARARNDGKQKKFLIDTWLMSCRVLGRQVEQEVLNCLAGSAVSAGADTLIGEYIPTEKNEMVRSHYQNLGFKPATANGVSGASVWQLSLSDYKPIPTAIHVSVKGRLANG